MGCCDESDTTTPCCSTSAAATAEKVRDRVREGYREIALHNILTTPETPRGGGCCGTQSPGELAASIGYSEEELRALPEGANLGLSCGNPTAIAELRPGQVVLDLGSGAGFDCFLAGPKVGAAGRVIGVDMTPEMLTRARGGVSQYREATGLDNVEFRLGEIEHLPVADASVDVVISNCVINLSPDKAQVFREIARVLRPGGKVAASDMALLRPLPAAVLEMVEALVGCVAGAVLLSEYEAMLKASGLRGVEVRAKPEYVAALRSFKDPLYARIQAALPPGDDIMNYVASVDVIARKA